MSNEYLTACNKLRNELNTLHDGKGMSWPKISELEKYSCVSYATLWKIANGYNPKGATARRLGIPATRVRIAADVSEEQRRRLKGYAAGYGVTWTEFCRALAGGDTSYDEFEQIDIDDMEKYLERKGEQ